MFFNLYNRILLPSVVSCGLLLLFASLPSVGLAQSVDDVFSESPLTLADLSPEGRFVVSNLAISMVPSEIRSTASTGDYDATISANIASILSLLQSVVIHSGGLSKVTTLPLFEAGGHTASIGGLLGVLMYEGGWGALDWTPQVSKSFLYEIQRALYGQSGVPSANRALLPLLYSAFGFTNDVSSILSEVGGTGTYLNYIDQDLKDTYDYLYSMRDVYIEEDLASESYPHASISVYDAVLDAVFLSQATDYSSSEPAIQVVDPVSASLLYEINYNAEQARYAIESLNSGYTPESSVVVTQDLSYIAGDTISDGTFDTSAIAARMRQYVGSMMTNVLPASAISVDTNFYYSITNYSLPLDGVGRFASNTLSGWVPPATDPSITLFNSFEYNGISIPGMLLDLSSAQLSTFQSRCHSFAAFMYAFFFMIASVLRVRSFVEHVSQGFADVHGETVAASISTDDISGRD